MIALVGGARVTVKCPNTDPPANSLNRFWEHIMTTTADLFWAKVKKQSGDECWLWLGAKTPNPRTKIPGYGAIRIGGRKGKTITTHRYVWTLMNGPIPQGMCVLHRCDTPACVRPNHLFLGTYADNNRDMGIKGRWRNQYKDNPPTHCKRGHPFDAENTRIGSHGERVCRTCVRDWMRAFRSTRKSK